MKGKTFLKIGKYGRPIFWSFLMVGSFYFFIIFVQREIFEGWFQFNYLLMDVFVMGITLILLALSTYKVIHPYVGKNENDDVDSGWSIGLSILLLVIIIQLSSHLFFSFDFINYLSSSNY